MNNILLLICLYLLVSTVARISQTINITYPGVPTCSSIVNLGSVENDLMDIILALDNIWGETRGATGGFCGNQNPCPTLTVATSCGPTARRRRRQTADLDAAIAINDLQ